MQVVYRARDLFDAHLAKHLLEEADLPVFVLGESLLGGAGELPMFGVLRVCVPDGYEEQANACLQVLSQGGGGVEEDILEDPEAMPGSVGAT